VLNDRGEQTENTHDNKARTKNQRAVRDIELRMQTTPMKVLVELPDPEPKPNFRTG
jgi:hypothetical protein